MRWVPLAILIYLVVLFQTTVLRVLSVTIPSLGPVCPDMMAITAVFLALRAATGADAMLAAWLLGLMVDLTAPGGPGSGAVVGPMAVAYALAAGGLFKVRDAIFRNSAVTQGILVLVFCALTHSAWVTVQALINYRAVTAFEYVRTLGQVGVSSVYSAMLAPLGHFLLNRCDRIILMMPSSRRGRR